MPPRLPFALRLSPFALILACQSASAPAAPAGLSAADRNSIDSLHAAISTAVVAGDFTAVTAMYAEGGSLMPPNEPIATGRMAMKEALGHFPPIAEMKLITNEAHGTADLATVRGTYMLLLAPPGQPVFADTGKFVELWRKQANGQWQITWDIFNSDKTPVTP